MAYSDLLVAVCGQAKLRVQGCRGHGRCSVQRAEWASTGLGVLVPLLVPLEAQCYSIAVVPQHSSVLGLSAWCSLRAHVSRKYTAHTHHETCSLLHFVLRDVHSDGGRDRGGSADSASCQCYGLSAGSTVRAGSAMRSCVVRRAQRLNTISCARTWG